MQEIGNDTVPSFSGAGCICASCAKSEMGKKKRNLENIRRQYDTRTAVQQPCTIPTSLYQKWAAIIVGGPELPWMISVEITTWRFWFRQFGGANSASFLMYSGFVTNSPEARLPHGPIPARMTAVCSVCGSRKRETMA